MQRARVGVAVLLAMVLVGCGSDDEAGSPSPPQPTPAASTPSPAAGPLDGTWRTEPVTVDDMLGTLREHDLARWANRFEKNSPVSDTPTTLILDIGDGTWNLYGQPRGGTREEIDYDAQLGVNGNTAVVSHEGEANTYRWSIRGDVLVLAWQKTTYAPHKGIPEEVFQRALYMTSEFRRTG